MDRTRLRAILTGGHSLVFDARARPTKPGAPPSESFFDNRVLRNVMLMKLIEVDAYAAKRRGLQTLLYFPFDPRQIGDGGASIVYGEESIAAELERTFGLNIDEAHKLRSDLDKLHVLSRVPSFSPFLLRDAFERTQLRVDRSFFAITENEAEIVREGLKAKLKPLAAMALDLAPEMLSEGRLELLVRKLWQLDDIAFLRPLSRALQLDDREAADVFYSWIGISYFRSEFAAREARVRALAEWLATGSHPRVGHAMPKDLEDYQEIRRRVRERLRATWASARDIFARFDACYAALVSGSRDPLPFVQFLRSVRADFAALGEGVSAIDQSLSVYEFWIGRASARKPTFDLARRIMTSVNDVWVLADGPQPVRKGTSLAAE